MSYDEHLISMAGGDGEPDLDAIQARADAATEGPWGTIADTYRSVPVHRIGADVSGADVAQVIHHGEQEAADAEFIAHARTDVPALLALVRSQQAQIERVRELHVPVMEDGNEVGCSMCDWEHPDGASWPCGTLAALTATEES